MQADRRRRGSRVASDQTEAGNDWFALRMQGRSSASSSGWTSQCQPSAPRSSRRSTTAGAALAATSSSNPPAASTTPQRGRTPAYGTNSPEWDPDWSYNSYGRMQTTYSQASASSSRAAHAGWGSASTRHSTAPMSAPFHQSHGPSSSTAGPRRASRNRPAADHDQGFDSWVATRMPSTSAPAHVENAAQTIYLPAEPPQRPIWDGRTRWPDAERWGIGDIWDGRTRWPDAEGWGIGNTHSPTDSPERFRNPVLPSRLRDLTPERSPSRGGPTSSAMAAAEAIERARWMHRPDSPASREGTPPPDSMEMSETSSESAASSGSRARGTVSAPEPTTRVAAASAAASNSNGVAIAATPSGADAERSQEQEASAAMLRGYTEEFREILQLLRELPPSEQIIPADRIEEMLELVRETPVSGQSSPAEDVRQSLHIMGRVRRYLEWRAQTATQQRTVQPLPAPGDATVVRVPSAQQETSAAGTEAGAAAQSGTSATTATATSQSQSASSSSRLPAAERERVRTLEVVPDVTKRLRKGLLYPLNNLLAQHSLKCSVKSRTTLELVVVRPRTSDIGEPDLMQVTESIFCLLSAGQPDEDELQISSELAHHITRYGGRLLRMLESELGVNIVTSEEASLSLSLQLRGPSDLVARAIVQLVELFSDYSRLEERFLQEQEQTVHLLADSVDADMGCQLLPDGTRSRRMRLDFRALAPVLTNGRRTGSKVCVGRRQELSQAVRDACASAGYRVDLRGGSVVNRLMQLATDQVRARSASEGVVILATGACDGPSTKQSLLNLLNAMLSKRGWRLEVWTWRLCCSPIFQELSEDARYRDVFKICYLDPFRDQLSYQVMSLDDDDEHNDNDNEEEEEEEEDEADAVDLCTWCLTEPALWAFEPCGHRALCHECFSLDDPRQLIGRTPVCFVCRTPCAQLRRQSAA